MRILILLSLLFLSACGRGVPDGARVVVAGDSVMAWNRSAGASVADALEARLGTPVGDVSLPLAEVMGGVGPLNIPNQLGGVSAEWVVLNGGANDLSTGCDCTDCDAVLGRLISEDGAQGAIPALVADLRQSGARVVWADYYTSPRYAGTECSATYRDLAARLARMAARDPGVSLVDMDDVFDPSDLSLFAGDRLHPSKIGSERIARLIAPEIQLTR
ncbi:GDSL-like Lipase/Acylhydrolase family protein [Pseudooceanicola antarcticus]|uniref:GDSL-like Lipase/Acylhydrolase family protein n=1 Tax=Pseudooceanicola antarcticus TaxID=1247613 RepID=A0A285J4B8_9RHOB|nr:SGNH/GDSL hydrolase family protein [Pseudooceanicola antarcticus]PJE29981.1 SGNH/GDSL hydrolase family protein [Pseudooceanicola antarcticus]SNY54903.1 GDSL-like Lipase/Acylhydrolase family protein [Pseudooceanicola antarcticus]